MFKNLSNNELLMIVFLVALALYLYSNGDIVEGMNFVVLFSKVQKFLLQ